MRVAVVHDYLKEYGGAERVLEALHEIYPDAPIYTSIFLPEFLGPHRVRFRDWDIKTSWFQRIPFNAKLISPFRLLAPLVFKTFDFSKYDVVLVSSTGAYVKQFKVQPFGFAQGESSKFKVVVYCHTPPRYLYGYATAREWKKNIIFRILGEIANHFLRLIDFKAAQRVDFFIANSGEVKNRIKKFYRREAVVIYPPVDFARSHSSKNQPRSYFLAGGRLAKPKHIDLIIETFGKLGLPLKIFGKEFALSLDVLVSRYPNVSLLGEVSDEDKYELMKNAKAYIFASEDEDFGITPVEAMSVGTPVIAYRSGGVLESVIDGKTGIFFDELTIKSLSKAVKRFNDLNHFKRNDSIEQAEKFSKERFKKEILAFVNSHQT